MHDYYYITLEEAVSIHERTIAHSGGGTLEIIDLGKLESVLSHIKNDDYYPSFVDKLSHLFFCTCQFHCFADGNKRLAITLSAQFLLNNGYMSVAKTFFQTMENISYNVAMGKIDKELLTEILKSVLDGDYKTNEELKLKIVHALM